MRRRTFRQQRSADFLYPCQNVSKIRWKKNYKNCPYQRCRKTLKLAPNFTDWVHEHILRKPDDKCPEEVLHPTCSVEILKKWLCVYVAETSHTGQEYPPGTIHSLLSGIFRHMKAQNSLYPNFIDRNNVNFVFFYTTLDNLYKKLQNDGVGQLSSFKAHRRYF